MPGERGSRCGCDARREWLLDRWFSVRGWWRSVTWGWRRGLRHRDRELAALEAIAGHLLGLKNEVRLLRQQVMYGRTEDPEATNREKFGALDPEWLARCRAAVRRPGKARPAEVAGEEEERDAQGLAG